MPSRERRTSGEAEGSGELLNGVGGGGTGEAVTRPLRAGLDSLTRRSADARRRVNGWSETLLDQTRRNPGRAAALALGAGYVLGGGLFSVLTARLVGAAVRIGVRVALVPLVTESFAALGHGLLGSESNGSSKDAEATH